MLLSPLPDRRVRSLASVGPWAEASLWCSWWGATSGSPFVLMKFLKFPYSHCSSVLLCVHGNVPLITWTIHYIPTSDTYPSYPSVFSTRDFLEIQQQKIFLFRKSKFERNLKLREIALWGTTICEKDGLKFCISSEATSKTHVSNWKKGHRVY